MADAFTRFRFDSLTIEEQESIRKKQQEQKKMQELLRSQIEEKERLRNQRREQSSERSIAEGQSFVNEFPARSEGTAANVGGISLARTRVVPQQPREEKHHEAIGAMEDFEGQKRVVSLQNRPAWQNNNPVVPSPDSAPASQQFEQDNLSFTRFRVDRLTEEQRDAHRRKAEEQRHMQEELARQVEEKRRRKEEERRRNKEEEDSEERKIMEYLARKQQQSEKHHRPVVSAVGVAGAVALGVEAPVTTNHDEAPRQYVGRDFGPDAIAAPPKRVTIEEPNSNISATDARADRHLSRRSPKRSAEAVRNEGIFGLPHTTKQRNKQIEEELMGSLVADYSVSQPQGRSPRRNVVDAEQEVDKVIKELDTNIELAAALGKAKGAASGKRSGREEGKARGKDFFQKVSGKRTNQPSPRGRRRLVTVKESSDRKHKVSGRPPLSTRDARSGHGQVRPSRRAQSASVVRGGDDSQHYEATVEGKSDGRKSVMSLQEAMKKSLSADSLFLALNDNPFATGVVECEVWSRQSKRLGETTQKRGMSSKIGPSSTLSRTVTRSIALESDSTFLRGSMENPFARDIVSDGKSLIEDSSSDTTLARREILQSEDATPLDEDALSEFMEKRTGVPCFSDALKNCFDSDVVLYDICKSSTSFRYQDSSALH